MAQSAHPSEGGRGDMEIADQKSTFHGFLIATVWTCAIIAMTVALLTVAFAISGGNWWTGLLAYTLIGIAVALVFKLRGAWWAFLVATLVLLALGGAIIPAIAGMMG
jgi:hypothetical protein